ncbi:MAG: GxxExxY protein, partial [Pirellulaceae bacterium]|nr:GxxExxY protein [Pirellulaceae bacterium]
MVFDDLSSRVIGCAIEVHWELGPGLLEFTYEQCLAHEFKLNGIAFQLQHPQPVQYKGIRLRSGYRLDVLVENRLIVE